MSVSSAPAVSVLSAPSSSAPLQSTASTILAAAQAQNATPPAATPDEAEADPGEELDAVVAAEEAAAKGLSWDEAMKRVPPGVAKLMKNMRSDYTKKTQELADQRKELQRERESLLKVKINEPTDIGEYDPFDEASVQKRIEVEVAKKLKLLLEPMQQEAELLKAESDYNAFLGSNPDFKTDTALRSEVQALLEKNPSLDLETAYWAAKGKQGKMSTAPKGQAERKLAAKEAAAVVSAPRRGVQPQKPEAAKLRSMSNADILAMAQAMNRA